MVTVREAMVEIHGEDWAKWSNVCEVRGEEVVILPHAARAQRFEPDAVAEANAMVLDGLWGSEEAMVWYRSAFNDAVGMRLDAPAPQDFVDTFTYLLEFIILDGGVWSEIEQEWVDDYIGRFLVEELAREDESLEDLDFDTAYAAWLRYVEDAGDYSLEGDTVLYDAAEVAYIAKDMLS